MFLIQVKLSGLVPAPNAQNVLPPETEEIAGGKEAIHKALADLGPMKVPEMKRMFISLALLALLSTENSGCARIYDIAQHDMGISAG